MHISPQLELRPCMHSYCPRWHNQYRDTQLTTRLHRFSRESTMRQYTKRKYITNILYVLQSSCSNLVKSRGFSRLGYTYNQTNLKPLRFVGGSISVVCMTVSGILSTPGCCNNISAAETRCAVSSNGSEVLFVSVFFTAHSCTPCFLRFSPSPFPFI